MFPKRTCGKLKIHTDGPYSVVRKINDNTYKIDLLRGYNISNVFDVADLTPHCKNEALPTQKK